MNRFLACIIASFVGIVPTISWAEDLYYSSPLGKSYLTIDSSRISVRFDTSLSGSDIGKLLQQSTNNLAIVQDAATVGRFKVIRLDGTKFTAEFRDSLMAISGIDLVEPYYVLQEGIDGPVGARFIAKVKRDIEEEQFRKICDSLDVLVVEKKIWYRNLFVLENTRKTGVGVLELANRFHGMKETVYSMPTFAINAEPFSYNLYDYYADNCDHVKKIVGWFNDSTVWDFWGVDDTIIVAVLDDGFEPHEDFPASRVLPGLDVGDLDSDVTPADDRAHGMGCAGLIGASHSQSPSSGSDSVSGVISMNPCVKLIPVKIWSDSGLTAFPDDMADGIEFAWKNGADILSMSFGYEYFTSSLYPILEALDSAATWGRNGLGTFMVAAAGNNGYSNRIVYPAVDTNVLAVGAVDLDDVHWPYSNYIWDTYYNPGIELVAPSGDCCYDGDMWTIDRMGVLGFNNQLDIGASWDCDRPYQASESGHLAEQTVIDNNNTNYMCHFGGTSGATPLVAGAASLVISLDPTLTRAEVGQVLMCSAVRSWSNPIIQRTPELGYGRVDAFRAVLAMSHGNADNIGPDVDIGDLTVLISYLFISLEPPFPSALLGDCDCDGVVDISDMNYLIAYLFGDPETGVYGPAPVRPCFSPWRETCPLTGN